MEASGIAEVVPDDHARGFHRIATRYVGPEIATEYVYEKLPALFGDVEWKLMYLRPTRFRALDHRDDEFFLEAKPQYLPEPRRSPLG